MKTVLVGTDNRGRKVVQEPGHLKFSLSILSELEHEGRVFRAFGKSSSNMPQHFTKQGRLFAASGDLWRKTSISGS